MATEYFIALDVHCAFTELAVVTTSGKLVKRDRSDTSIPAIAKLIDGIRKPRCLTFEEGPLAGWLARNLASRVERLVVCDPRRNHLVAKDGDKDDPIDAEKLAQLFRGGYLRAVHQTDTLDRALVKQHVGFYHTRVRERVRQGNQLVALLRRQGVFVSIDDLIDDADRRSVWRRLPQHKTLLKDLDLLWEEYSLLTVHEATLRSELVRLARRQEPVRRFVDVPGFGWIRAITFYVYIDTPCRFHNKSALWKYCGIGLERRHSGRGPIKVRLVKQANRHLKNVLLGAAKSAVAQVDSPFADKYRYWTQEEGLHPSTARRNVARSLAATLWSLWKTGGEYDPARVCGAGRPTTLKRTTS